MQSVYSPQFRAAMTMMFPHEGGWSDHKDDPGGATNLGITIGTLKTAVRRGIVQGPATRQRLRQLTRAEAIDIYHRMYWQAVRADELPVGVDYMVFDAQVNQGHGGQFLQRAINEWTRSKLKVDNVVGPRTLEALQRLMRFRAVGETEFIRDVAMHRLLHYSVLQMTFRRGWFRRVLDVFRVATMQAADDSAW